MTTGTCCYCYRAIPVGDACCRSCVTPSPCNDCGNYICTCGSSTIHDHLSGDEINLAQYMSPSVAATMLADLHLYGSAYRPMSGSWARIPSAAYITADYGTTGFHTWVVVPAPLDQATIDNYELTTVIG